MIKVDLSFLKGVELVELSEKPTAIKAKSSKLPEGLTMRVYANGDVYPSEKFATRYNLHFSDQIESVIEGTDELRITTPGNGMNIFNSSDWLQFPKQEQELLFVALIPREGNKNINLFSQARYKDGVALRNVFTPSKSNFSKLLLESITKGLGIKWDEVEYIDLSIEEDYPQTASNDIYFLPKILRKGPRSGSVSYMQYNNIYVWPMSLSGMKVKEVEETPVLKEEPVVKSETKSVPGVVNLDALKPVKPLFPSPKEEEEAVEDKTEDPYPFNSDEGEKVADPISTGKEAFFKALEDDKEADVEFHTTAEEIDPGKDMNAEEVVEVEEDNTTEKPISDKITLKPTRTIPKGLKDFL